MTSSHPFSRASSGFDNSSGSAVGRVIAIGASAGGLDACRALLEAMPSGGGNIFILVQHLDPVHESLLAELLSSHTTMTVVQAEDGRRLEPDHLFIIPPGCYIAVQDDTIRLTVPPVRHGMRMPYDFLLSSLAAEYGARATAVVLSGTGTDGSIGIRLIREAGGQVYVQDPDEADYDGMPKSAIDSGMAEHVMPLAAIAQALHRPPSATADAGPLSKQAIVDRILTILRVSAGKDFALYKQGTLHRRLERRMAMAGIASSDTARYLSFLEENPLELSQLAADILINVTNFFRDPEVFERLRTKIVPDLVANHPPGRTLRLWVAGCSTGEEAYSLGMLVQECISQTRRDIRMQIFASDADEEAVAFARDGVYPLTIKMDVSPERLQRFFSQEEHGYRIASELRSSIIFAVQNVLSDPPFSNIDLISCRNLLIYLGSEAQAKVIGLFHFALNDNGILLLGNTETVGAATNRFDVIDKSARIFRRKGQRGRYGFAVNASDNVRVPAQQGQVPGRQAALAELTRRTILDSYAPATVLINRKYEYLYSLGPVQRYLRIAPGYPTQDLFTMTPRSVHTKLRSALHRAQQEKVRTVAIGLYHDAADTLSRYEIAVQPVISEGEELFLVSFLDVAQPSQAGDLPEPSHDDRSGTLERELATTRTELQAAIRDLENAAEEQKAINSETLSLNEEYQSANEELLTSKEELQSLNEELTALNAQLQEALERQRATANDLENVLYSTDVATIFLDPGLNIRYFTPATRSIFNVIMGDIGRPLADLNARVPDPTLLGDAAAVLKGSPPKEREVRTGNGTWYMRRVMPYRTQEGGTEGVVITFADVSTQHRAHEALDRAKRAAERANAAKSRFLATASHDLRQPLQSLVLLQGLLEKSVDGEKPQKLVRSFRDTLGSMSEMLNALLDINQIEAGTVYPRIVTCKVNDVLQRLNDEFGYSTMEKGISLRFVPSSQLVRTDPRLLEQMIRNLLANALKYTREGKILLGCRRHKDALTIEVWDSGIGIAAHELQAIFDEYHQAANDGAEAELGLGLGLSIVKRLSALLGHRIQVRSIPGKGSVFSIHVALGKEDPQQERTPVEKNLEAPPVRGTVLVVEDDQKIRNLIEIALRDEQHLVYAADNGTAAINLVSGGGVIPTLILADYNLPNDTNGINVTRELRAILGRNIPAIILTGDITAETLRILSAEDCLHMPKPVSLADILRAIQLLLHASGIEPEGTRQEPQASPSAEPAIFVIDDDRSIREALQETFEADGRRVKAFSDGETFLAAFDDASVGCLVMDVKLPGISGLDVLLTLRRRGVRLPIVMITGAGDVATAVLAMKAGASDFIEKPIGPSDLLACVSKALANSRNTGLQDIRQRHAKARLARLTGRQREILDRVLAGQPSKVIAQDFDISQRTVEAHRAAIMRRMQVGSLPALARLVVLAESDASDVQG
ncbi:response regulator [Shinella sp. WSJ-2]|uniref:chemotaxis protein CheB n=1 Tax=Shinella sp. WSJ-2 TaxID=2303749 RepID=UPI000E3E9D34|nr:chemotaxis protein CheB [Shinella sp. WSJ-2]RFZ86982.1 response regulator [Shinella sp. WSJ-2]